MKLFDETEGPLSNTHMPFLTKIGGKKLLFFCGDGGDVNDVPQMGGALKYRVWKLMLCRLSTMEGRELTPPQAGPESVVCSPEVYYCAADGFYHITYSIGSRGLYQPPAYLLYDSVLVPTDGGFFELGDTEVVLTPRHRNIFNGFKTDKWVIYHNTNESYGDGVNSVFNISEYGTGIRHRVKTDFTAIYRISYLWDSPLKLLITGSTLLGELSTYLYNWDAREVEGEVVAENAPVYKCTIFKGNLVHTVQKNDGNFEERDLHITQDWEILPDLDFTITPV